MQQPFADDAAIKPGAGDSAAKQRLVEEGNKAFDANEFERALDCYHRASLVAGADPEVWNLLGLAYMNLDFLEEAWRSYKLALQIDPDNLDSLWYAGEFLIDIEDLALARLVLGRYLELEEDESKRREAQEMFKEANLELGEDGNEPVPLGFAEENDLADDEKDSDELGGVEGDAEPASSQGDEEDEDGVDGDYQAGGETELEDPEQFVAHLSLQLVVADSKCNNCETAIPKDAPYCYSCKAPHFYESR